MFKPSYPLHKLTPQTILPPRDAVLENTENKKELISQLCLIDESIPMIGDECPFGHEEADVNIIAYIYTLIKQGKRKFQVNADDNDIFVLLMYFLSKWKLPDVSIQLRKFDGTLIDINKSVDQFDACSSLLAAHALSGCDTVSYPFKKGKVSAINLIKRQKLALDSLGDHTAQNNVVLHQGKSFICSLYGRKNVSMSEFNTPQALQQQSKYSSNQDVATYRTCTRVTYHESTPAVYSVESS